MCKIIIVVLSLVSLSCVSEGQIIQDLPCDSNIALQSNFDIEQFLGTWIEHSRADHPQGGDCSTVTFERVGDAVTVQHSTVRQNFLEEYFGTASVPTGSAALTLNMPQLSSDPIDFWPMLTDYTNFALMYRCENVGTNQRRLFIWQLSRQPAFGGSMMIPALMNNTMINILGINSNDLLEVDHGDEACYQLPIIAAGQPVVLPGECNPNITGVQNFQAGAFLGVWHQISSYHSENSIGTCNRAEYSSQDGIRVDVINSEVFNQQLFAIEGYATVISADGSGTLNVVLDVGGQLVESELVVYATDYERWAISYTCQNIANNQRRVYSWIVSRTRQLPAAAQAEVDAAVNSFLDLNARYYQATDQSNSACFYFPTPTANAPVVFGGQCDLSIPVVQGFDAASYLGLWHDIESYSTPFQFGTCANAFYSLGSEGVDVFNTQVVNQTLNTINGVAVPVGTEAKLIVTFPIEGTNFTIDTDYWVIATDYASYSLVYSCTNVNEYQQQVTMWKLSRTKALTAAATTAINTAMATQLVFDQRYFQSMDQSREGCFYYPEPRAGEQVVFPGQCDDEDIPVVANFNLASFTGQWYEIEAYPKDPQPGQCIEHQFSVTTSAGFNLVSSNVDDQLLGISNSQLTFINGSDARFTLTTSNGTGTISFPYYIVATDYTNYALAYSCINLNEDFRGIFSWKLSRTRDLPASSSTAINNTMSNIVVLSNDYFEPIDQSDSACFYLPELAPGEPVIFPGQCDTDVPVITNFDAAAYLGRWRLIETYPSANQEGACNQANYALAANGNVIVYNTEVLNQTLREATGEATLAAAVGGQTPGQLIVTFPESNDTFDLFVLATDYTTYSLVYGCVNINSEQRQVYSWKMSRTTNLTTAAVNAINAVVNNVEVLNNRYYQTIDHSDDACFYFPEPDSGTPVVFRGQCDENIPVVTNFDAVAYMGLWHDIERFPAPFQDGSCGNAFYTLLDGPVVDVYNTQVLNETLDTINGFAVLDLANETDTSAKLLVTFPVNGFNVTTTYWVLATDYSSYALVYSCNNIDDERRSVTMWKLSRTKSLTAAANTAINTVMAIRDIFDQRYFVATDQSREGCFYYPEPIPGQQVVFPGQCDDENIPVVANFNLNSFAGQWYEIEAYPKDPQPGQCIDHQFSVTSNTGFNLISSNVDDQLLGISTSQLTFSNGTDARFTLTTSNGTSTISFPYYIIATDYTNYALAYSCVDVNEDFRGIFSWKLSRTRQLPASSTTAINNAISDIAVVSNDYFEPINQSDSACFYLPELAPGEPVIFPGQCDTDVPVITNFDAAAYLGRWRLIETYPSANQEGACNQANYALAANGNVIVYNTEVLNQTLREATGEATLAAAVGGQTPGQLIVTFPESNDTFDLFVLATDYTSYSLVYGCVNINSEQRQVYSWKMSRTTNLTTAAVNAINAVVNNVDVLNDRYYQTIDHSDDACFYFPEPDSGTPVVFRGQCDETIPVVTNFDAVAYMGLWHDVERFPAPFQDGSCGNAFYTLLDGPVVDVYNTQVINETLDTINGFAVLDLANETDTSAKLLVTFPVNGFNVTTTYWVLATDYSSYALVYSCNNIDDERRSVTMWKLSRTKSLTATANAAINSVLAIRDIFDQRYFITMDQSREGCFYYPEPVPGQQVVFPGQCGDENIPVVANFNLNSFSGQWYEIETYPKDFQPGQCVDHQFSVTSNTGFNLISSNVNNQLLGISSSQLILNDGSNANFTLATSNGTGIISFPYYIIATDYTNYALAYSCVAVNDDFRGIFSWKLSRTRQLPASSITAINNAMSDITVISNDYFEPVNQSDSACFYLPELAPGEPVIFPGQCDPDIPVVQNFNVNAYLGLWRTIETYASDFQLGTCGDATYTPGPDGTVTVFNTEVINQTLSTIEGSARLASTDGSGKLLVTFPGAVTDSEYWILDTDYVSYSLVYSCYNINENQRRVHSWKLSRTNALSTAAVAAINQVVNTVNVLDARYYQTVDRTDASCFYFPEPDGSPVIFRGQCDQSVPVVTNFDPVAYMGTWYDIESYPAPFQGGTCGTANYDLNLDTLVVYVENTQVINPGLGPVLDVQTGTAVLAVTDGSAKLIVTFDVNGVIINTDYWVLATDYVNYALVYSCQNINAEQRQVNSFKLSRTRTLSAAAQTAISNAINQVQVLEQRYFVEGGQSEEDCFFYPDNEGGDVILDGQCIPDAQVPAITNFNSVLFSGVWHEAARFPSDLQVGECTAAEYSIGTQNQITITQTEVNQEFQNQSTIPGTLSTDGRGVITANIVGIPFNTFYVLDTDYNDFALMYGCRNLDNSTKQVYSWKLSRSRSGLSDAANARVNELVLNNVDLFENYYYYTDQSNNACFHYPEFAELPPAIVLPGPCDESIRGVANFNAAAYLGRWIEIERYPQRDQFGTCDRAYYSLGETNVLVRNTQVLNQTLAEQLGFAEVASTDGTGLLNVTFVVQGITLHANYYILATDYDTYALVYSCRNLDADSRQVYSWKLSRTTSLTVQAISAIDAAISQTQGLAQQYYATTSQTDEDCFYIPEVDVDAAPVFRGRCNENVTGVANFDTARYAGWWHEIERYPVDNNRGECISSQKYLESGYTYQVVDTVVSNNVAEVATGVIQVTADGRLTKTINGQTQVMWVLATDYETYSLLYSCESADELNEYRRVWSAKHSKARSLTPAAQAAMAPVIEANEVLYPQFYLPVDQSDATCFHYPELTGQQVILPGQCDSIPVVANFDVVAYEGTWYQIERYPQLHEYLGSTCIGARYTLNSETGVVTVLNWEIIDGVLETIEGTATLSSTDGSATLDVVLPVVGTNDTVTTNLYVLATDYESYSLVYSCSNINQFQRTIGAWKLSRERTMPDAGNTAINAIMAVRDELHQPYFIEVEQNDECIEPSSGTFLRSSLLVMLICAVWQMLS